MFCYLSGPLEDDGYASYVKEYKGKPCISSELYTVELLQKFTSLSRETRNFYKHGPALTQENAESFPIDVASDPKGGKMAEIMCNGGADIVPAFEIEQ